MASYLKTVGITYGVYLLVAAMFPTDSISMLRCWLVGDTAVSAYVLSGASYTLHEMRNGVPPKF